MYLIKQNKILVPVDDSDKSELNKIGEGTVLKVTAPRNYKFHKKGFALLNIGFENQNKFTNFEIYRKVQTILAGYFDEVTQPDGKVYKLPHSLSFDSMSAETFGKWYVDTINVISLQIETATDVINNEIENKLKKIEKFY